MSPPPLLIRRRVSPSLKLNLRLTTRAPTNHIRPKPIPASDTKPKPTPFRQLPLKFARRQGPSKRRPAHRVHAALRPRRVPIRREPGTDSEEQFRPVFQSSPMPDFRFRVRRRSEHPTPAAIVARWSEASSGASNPESPVNFLLPINLNQSNKPLVRVYRINPQSQKPPRPKLSSSRTLYNTIKRPVYRKDPHNQRLPKPKPSPLRTPRDAESSFKSPVEPRMTNPSRLASGTTPIVRYLEETYIRKYETNSLGLGGAKPDEQLIPIFAWSPNESINQKRGLSPSSQPNDTKNSKIQTARSQGLFRLRMGLYSYIKFRPYRYRRGGSRQYNTVLKEAWLISSAISQVEYELNSLITRKQITKMTPRRIKGRLRPRRELYPFLYFYHDTTSQAKKALDSWKQITNNRSHRKKRRLHIQRGLDPFSYYFHAHKSEKRSPQPAKIIFRQRSVKVLEIRKHNTHRSFNLRTYIRPYRRLDKRLKQTEFYKTQSVTTKERLVRKHILGIRFQLVLNEALRIIDKTTGSGQKTSSMPNVTDGEEMNVLDFIRMANPDFQIKLNRVVRDNLAAAYSRPFEHPFLQTSQDSHVRTSTDEEMDELVRAAEAKGYNSREAGLIRDVVMLARGSSGDIFTRGADSHSSKRTVDEDRGDPPTSGLRRRRRQARAQQRLNQASQSLSALAADGKSLPDTSQLSPQGVKKIRMSRPNGSANVFDRNP
jgi:hypothetical protein